VSSGERLERVGAAAGRLQGVAREAVWRARPVRIPPLEPSWPLQDGVRDRVQVVWPTRYDWPDTGRWVDSLVAGFRAHVRVRFAELDQPYHHVVVFRLELDGRSHEVAVDYADRSDVNDECRQRCALYFKMQFLGGGYGDEAVVPGGFPPSWPGLYQYLGRLRRIRRRRGFASDVYGRFSEAPSPDTRRRAVRLLREQQRFTYEGGLRMLRYSRYLAEIARARVCIDLPGYGDFCFRLIDYLAVGACVIGPRPSTVLHAPLTDRVNVVYCADDLSDLVDLCEYYVNHADERERIADAAAVHFDRYLERTQWAAYCLHTAGRHLL
jgi:glycosyl transferase family 1